MRRFGTEGGIIARRYFVSGHVQGVGFRFFTDDVARRDGVGGFVRNLGDGRVEIVAEGEREAVERFERALCQGPPLSRVERVAMEQLEPTGLKIGFRIH